MELFLSYVPDEADNLDTVLDVLDKTGYSVQYDYETIAQTNWQTAIVNRMRQTEALLAVITPQTVQSEWCHWTITVAKHLDKPIVPIMIRTAEIPVSIQGSLLLDLSDDNETSLAVFQQALQNMRQPQERVTQPVPAVKRDKARETDEYRAVDGMLRGGQRDTETSEYYEINREIFFLIQPLVEDASTVYMPLLSSQEELLPTWQKIFDAHMCVFNLSTIDTQGWIEVGIAVALSKPLLLVASTDEILPRVLEQYNILRYQAVNDLEPQFAKLKDNGFFTIKKANGYCHLCEAVSCPALERRVDNQAYKVITDSRMLWQGLLGTLRNTIQEIATANPAYSSDRSPTICDLRASIMESKFILTHLDYIQNPINLIYLGLAMGHTKPWLMLYQRGNNLPTILEAVSKVEDIGISDLEDQQMRNIEQFLHAVYGTRTHSNKPDTAPQFAWQSLMAKAKAQMTSPQEGRTEMLKGKLMIARIDGDEIVDKLFLPEDDPTLVFGREGGNVQVDLGSKYASLMHFHIYESGERYFVEDLGSRNGTYHNGTLLRRNTPTELYLEDMVMAAGASFLIWDERPLTYAPQKLGFVKGTGSNYQIRLNIPPPNGLVSLNQSIGLQVMYQNHRGAMKKARFETQSYYPFGQILKALVEGLDLPKGSYQLHYHHQRLTPDSSPMQMNLRPNTVLEITSGTNKGQNAMNTVVRAIDHCERDLVTEQGQRKYRDGFRYAELGELYKIAYRNLYNETPETIDESLFDRLVCPTCQQPLYPALKVAIKRR